MAPKPLPDQSVLLQLLRYDRRTGKLYWRKRSEEMFGGSRPANACSIWNNRYAGTEALASVGAGGYLGGHIFGASYRAHRVIWKMVYGVDPGPEVDHANGNRRNNRLRNLISGTKLTNQKNAKRRRDNTTGAAGVYRHGRKWQARIHANKRAIALGTFDTFEQAVAARRAAHVEHGFTERHGT